MTTEAILEVLRDTGVMQQGHFSLTSGKHSDRYMQCAHLFAHPASAGALTAHLVEQLAGIDIDIVASPAVGGILFGYELARQLNVPNIFAERQEGKLTFRRGFAIEPGQRVAVAEDAITTGGSVQEVIDLVRSAGGEVVAVGVIVDRSGGKANFGAPLFSAVKMDLAAWQPKDCPLCQSGMPITKPGSRGLGTKA